LDQTEAGIMRTLFTARAFAATAAATTLVIGGTLPSAGAASSDRRDDRGRAWVEVCQRIQGGHGDHIAKDRRDDRDFHGSYLVESRRDDEDVDLYGRRDCDTVEVRAGRVTVSVEREPRGTELRGRDTFRFRIDRGDTERVTFRYREDDDHGHGGH
jgi:hypothetical protein